MKRISGTDTQFQLFPLLGLFLVGLLVLSNCNLSVAKMVVPTGAAQISTLYLAIPGQTTWYVAVDGNDNNHCLSLQAPCQHISAAVERAGPGDTIDIGAGSYLEGLVVEKSLNFIGAGVDGTIISAYELHKTVFVLLGQGNAAGAIAVSIRALTIQKGISNTDENDAGGNGGGISAIDADLNLDNVLITQNYADGNGGGVYCQSTFSPLRNVIIQNSTIDHNEAFKDGGGIWCNSNLTLENVVFNHNIADGAQGRWGHGPGVMANGKTVIRNSIFTDQWSIYRSDAIFHNNIGIQENTLLVEDSVIDSNSTGGIETNSAVIRRTTITNNAGNGIENYGELYIENSTISNSSLSDWSDGGIVTHENGHSSIVNATLVGNYFGVSVVWGGQATMTNTLIVDSHQACHFANDPGKPVSMINGDHNLVTDTTCASAATFISDAGLGDFGDHGGSTSTYSLLSRSPAIDAGKNINHMNEDQRGLPRPVDGNGDGIKGFDVGAYEAAASTVDLNQGHQPIPYITPTFTRTPTLTSTPSRIFFTPNINAWCRVGPDLSFPFTDIAMTNQPYLMDGRNLDNTWYRIMVTASRGCWVPGSAGSSSGDTSLLRVLAEVPTFTPTDIPTQEINCSAFTDQSSCEALLVCMWYVPASTAPFCTHE